MLWVGDFHASYAGYTQAGLNYLMALKSVGFREVEIFPLGGMWANRLPTWAASLMHNPPMGVSRTPVVVHTLPTNLSDVQLGGSQRAGLITFETDRLPKWLCRELNRITSSLIVPCAFNEAGLREAGYAHPITVVPHTIGSWWWETAPEPTADLTEGRPFTFTYVGTWIPRKNPRAILSAYLDAFPTPRKEVALALKIVASAGYSAQIKEIIGNRPDIWIWDEVWSERQVQWLHANTDCFVSAHHGEGWGLGPFQAKLLAKPVIYTDWSAVKEFCAPEHGDIPIDYDLVAVGDVGMTMMPMYVEPEGTLRWADPKHESLVEAMRTMADAPTRYQELAQAAAPALQNRFRWETVGAQLAKVIGSL